MQSIRQTRRRCRTAWQWKARNLALATIALGLLLLSPRAMAAELEGFGDEDVEDVRPNKLQFDSSVDFAAAAPPPPPVQSSTPAQEAQPTGGTPLKGSVEEEDDSAVPLPPFWSQKYKWEPIMMGIISIFITTFVIGRGMNKRIAEAFAKHYAGEDGVLAKNFALIGPTTEDEYKKENYSPLSPTDALMQDGQSLFILYATGRRYCLGLTATIELQPRQDILAMAYGLMDPSDDLVKIDVFMTEEMPPMVLAVGRRRVMRNLVKDAEDLNNYTLQIDAGTKRKWPEALQVYAESSQLFHDIITDSVIDHLFSEKAFESVGKYFVLLHFTDQDASPTQKRVLRFQFRLPSADNMEAISKLMAAIPIFIDVVARYRMSKEARAKADAARAKVAEKKAREKLAAEKEESKKELTKKQKEKLQKKQSSAGKIKMMVRKG